jgi:acetyl-CoA synthetase
MEYEAVNAVAVVGVEDETRGQIVKVCIVLERGFDESDELVTEIQEYAKSKMAKYKYPREIEFLEELPKDEVGKIQYSELKDRA